jgi:hypothetical protein
MLEEQEQTAARLCWIMPDTARFPTDRGPHAADPSACELIVVCEIF